MCIHGLRALHESVLDGSNGGDIVAGRRHIQIGDRPVGPGEPVFIIAEIGINHDGALERAHALVDAAADSGADAVKFQTVDADASYVPGNPSYEVFSGKNFDIGQYKELCVHCRERGIFFFTTPGDTPSLDLCGSLDLPALKISSGLMSNLPFILSATELGVPMIISTGMAYLWEVLRIAERLEDHGFSDMALLHCTSIYPAPDDTLNLNVIKSLQAFLPYPVGYSNHSLSNVACTSAVALGACILEVHCTLDRKRPGADHHISFEPAAFRSMVGDVRRCEAMLGERWKRPDPAEVEGRTRIRRGIVARTDIEKGQIIREDMVGLMRALDDPGLPAYLYHVIVGKRTMRAVRKHEPIGWDCITESDA